MRRLVEIVFTMGVCYLCISITGCSKRIHYTEIVEKYKYKNYNEYKYYVKRIPKEYNTYRTGLQQPYDVPLFIAADSVVIDSAWLLCDNGNKYLFWYDVPELTEHNYKQVLDTTVWFYFREDADDDLPVYMYESSKPTMSKPSSGRGHSVKIGNSKVLYKWIFDSPMVFQQAIVNVQYFNENNAFWLDTEWPFIQSLNPLNTYVRVLYPVCPLKDFLEAGFDTTGMRHL